MYGINRNIVECKYYYTCFLRNCQWELIETLWNVNYKPQPKQKNVP